MEKRDAQRREGRVVVEVIGLVRDGTSARLQSGIFLQELLLGISHVDGM